MSSLIATSLRTGNVVPVDSMVTDGQGNLGKFTYASRANDVGRDGKIIVNGREYYARVWGLRVGLETLDCGCPVAIVSDEGHQEGCSKR